MQEKDIIEKIIAEACNYENGEDSGEVECVCGWKGSADETVPINPEICDAGRCCPKCGLYLWEG